MEIVGEDSQQAWVDAVRRARRGPARNAPAGGAPPYKGLAPFGPTDASIFFGRASAAAALVAQVKSLSDQSLVGPLVVTGASGVGKSSLVGAGLVPRIEHGDVPGIQKSWTIRPSAGLEIATALNEDGERRLIVVDQLEELFTRANQARMRPANFVADVLATARQSRSVVIFILRSDFYEAATRIPDLARGLERFSIVVPAMVEAEIEEAISDPPRVCGTEVSDGFVHAALRDAVPKAGAVASELLPLLGHALLAAWEQSPGARLTADDYLVTGGVSGAIEATASHTYDSLDPTHRDAARRFFLRCVSVDAQGLATRCPVALSGLDSVESHVADAFVTARLLIVDGDNVTLAHEAVIEAWSRLAAWVSEMTTSLQYRRQVGDAAAAWIAADRDPLALVRGGRLRPMRALAEYDDTRRLLKPVEVEFLNACVDAERRERVSARRRSAILTSLAAVTTALAVIAAILVVVAHRQRNQAERTEANARLDRSLAQSRELAARSARLRAKDPTLASQLAAAAYRLAPTVEARSALLDAASLGLPTRLRSTHGVAQAVAFSPDGRLIAVGNGDGSVELWAYGAKSKVGRATLPTARSGEIFAVAFSPDGRFLAVSGKDPDVLLYDVSVPVAPREVRRLSGPAATVYGLVFIRSGAQLWAASADGAVYRWDLDGGDNASKVPISEAPVQAIATDAAGETVAAASTDGTVRVWSLAGTSGGDRLIHMEGMIMTVALDPKGERLVAGTRDGTADLWQLSEAPTKARPAKMPNHESWVNATAFSPDGSLLATGGSDDLIRLVDPTSGDVVGSFRTASPVTGLVFSPSGGDLAATAADGGLRIFTVPGPALYGSPSTVYASAFSADGNEVLLDSGSQDPAVWTWNIDDGDRPRRGPQLRQDGSALNGTASLGGSVLAVGSSNGAVYVWNVDEQLHASGSARRLNAGRSSIESTAVSEDGQFLAAASDDHNVYLFKLDASNGGERPHVLTGLHNEAYKVVFAPNSRMLVGTGANAEAVLWSVAANGSAVVTAAISDLGTYVYAAAFSPDGRTLAIGGADRKVRLFDISDPSAPIRLTSPFGGPSDYVNSVAFAPDGSTLAAASSDGVLWIWEVTDRSRPRIWAQLDPDSGPLFTVAFDPSGDRLLAAGTQRVGWIWQSSPEAAAALICARSGDISRSEWATVMPTVPWRAAC